MKHLNSFLAQGQRDLNQTFSKNSNAQGVAGAEGGGGDAEASVQPVYNWQELSCK